MKICIECGVEYDPSGRNCSRRKYCSKKCQVKVVQRNHYNRYPEKYKEKRDKSTEDWVKKTLWAIKARAKTKGLPFNLDYEDLQLIETCPVLGIPLVKTHGTSGKVGYKPNAPSVDRIKPELGYVKGNVRVISARANLLKNNAELWELERVVEDLRCLNKKL